MVMSRTEPKSTLFSVPVCHNEMAVSNPEVPWKPRRPTTVPRSSLRLAFLSGLRSGGIAGGIAGGIMMLLERKLPTTSEGVANGFV